MGGGPAAEPGASVPLTRPPERYGDDRPSWHRVLARVLVVTLALVSVAFLVWVAVVGQRDGVTATDVGFRLEGDDLAAGELEVDFAVSMDPGSTATCVLRALNDRFAVVGTAEVDVPASGARTQRLTGVVRVSEPAVSAGVESCRLTEG